MSKLMFLFSGMIIGALSILSCGDESPPIADAATCDCAVAEPPLAGRIIEVIETTVLLPANVGPQNGKGSGGAICPRDSILLTGGCAANEGQAPDVVVEQSYPSPLSPTSGGKAWLCKWKNNTNAEVTVRGVARCLVAQ